MFTSIKSFLRNLIVRSQSYTGTDNLYIARGGFWLSTSFVFNSLLSLGLVIAFANLVPKEVYGTYKYILSIAGILGFLTVTGMNGAISQMVAQGHRGLLPYSVGVQIRWNLLYTIGSLIIATYYGVQGNLLLAFGITLLGVTFPIITACNTYGAYLTGRRDFKRATIIGVTLSLTQSLLTLIVIIVIPTVPAFLLVYSLGTLIPAIYFCIKIMGEDRAEVNPKDKFTLKKYAGHLTLMNILSTVDSYLDKVLLFQNVGSVQLATYTLALAGPERIRGYLKSIGVIFLPRLAERSLKDIRRSYYIRVGQGILVGLVVAGAYWVIAPYLFTIFLPRYTDAIPFSRALGLVNALIIPAAYMGGIFRAHRMVRALYLSSVGGHGFRILAYIILTPLFGIWGLVYATLATYVLGLIYNTILWEYFSRRLLRIN